MPINVMRNDIELVDIIQLIYQNANGIETIRTRSRSQYLTLYIVLIITFCHRLTEQHENIKD